MQTFHEHLSTAIRSTGLPPRSLAPGECQTRSSRRCNLCFAVTLTYEDELRVKSRAIRNFLERHIPSPLVEDLVPSPLGRGYRTVTKRRVFHTQGRAILGLISPSDDDPARGLDVLRCPIEPETHGSIYAEVQRLLATPEARALASALTYVIVKGSGAEEILILNVREISSGLIRTSNSISRSLSARCPSVSGMYLYEGAPESNYYLGTKNPRTRMPFRRIHGRKELYHRVAGKPFLYPPLAFSQVNHSILELLTGRVADLLHLQPTDHLYDLYCGYGLFALSYASRISRVTGIEVSGDAVKAAVDNAKRQHARNARFFRRDVTPESLQSIVRGSGARTSVLLDPPRKGTAEGVIEFLSAFRPARAVHLFCNVDLMSVELKRWTSGGYRIRRAVPYDMFPGTSAIEVAVLLEPEASRDEARLPQPGSSSIKQNT